MRLRTAANDLNSGHPLSCMRQKARCARLSPLLVAKDSLAGVEMARQIPLQKQVDSIELMCDLVYCGILFSIL